MISQAPDAMTMEFPMKFLPAAEVHRLLPFPGLIEAMRESHCRGMPAVATSLLQDPDPKSANRFNVLNAWAARRHIGTKLVSIFPGNDASGSGLPSIQGVYVLFEATHGAPVLVADGTALTLRKTASDSALGASYLARLDTETMLMVGAGALAPYVIEAHRAARPSIRKIILWNRRLERAAALARRLETQGIVAEVATDLEAAVRSADVIACATMSAEPLVKGAWLRPGTHLDLIGGWRADMREADDEAVRRAEVYVNARELAAGCGDLLHPIASGAFSWSDLRGDLYDLCNGRVAGRQGDEITLYKNAGGGHLDLFTAQYLARFAPGP